MSYMRVIPRDLFNEANLLKCLGKVAINLELLNLPSVALDYDEYEGEAFDIVQDSDSGNTSVRNIVLTINYRTFWFWRPLNSREEWPLYVTDDEGNEIAVFHPNGSFSQEFVTFLETVSNDE